MTIKKRILQHLESNGLFDDQAQEVFAALEKSQGAVMQGGPVSGGRWNDEETGYPPQLMAVLIVAADMEAVNWIDANLPKHWARGIFAGPAA